jgi:oligopeptidase B
VSKSAEAPVATRKPASIAHHGIAVADDYTWLRADNWQEVMRDASLLDPDIRAYLDAENAWLDQCMAPTEKLQETLFKEIRGRIKEDDSSPPVPDGPFAYATKYLTGAEHPRLVRTLREGGGETVLIDGDAMAEGKDFFRLGGVAHSPDHGLLAYSYDDVGSEYFSIRVRDTTTLEDADDVIKDSGGSPVWALDSKSFFYVRLDANHRPSRVYRHVLGQDSADDQLIFEEENSGYFVGIGATLDRRYLQISSHDHESSEVWLIPTDQPETAPTLFMAREANHEYSVEHGGNQFYILTNRDGAEDFRIVATPDNKTAPEHWQEVVPHVPGRLILNFALLANHLVRFERIDGLPRVLVRDMSTGDEHDIAFDEEAYSLGLSVGLEFDTTMIRFTYSSMKTPARTYDYDMVTRERTMLKEQEIPSGHDADDYVTRRIMAKSHDGETMPVSLLHHKNTKIDGSAPLLLYGYGAYGIAIPAGFSVTRLSLVDRGIVYAIAHVRGGKDKGYGWYKAGKMFEKKNSFLDFLAAGEVLIEAGYTSRGRIIAQGGSAGGLLVGAVANMDPDLFLGVIGEVPFVDVLATMLDADLPLTPPEWPEWGNPIESREAFDYILSYSPVDNVTEQAYPHMLITGGLADPRVTYWEPTKWAAKLRALRTDDRLTLLKMNIQAGHGGKPGRFDALHEVALTQAFALMIAGKT